MDSPGRELANCSSRYLVLLRDLTLCGPFQVVHVPTEGGIFEARVSPGSFLYLYIFLHLFHMFLYTLFVLSNNFGFEIYCCITAGNGPFISSTPSFEIYKNICIISICKLVFLVLIYIYIYIYREREIDR